MYILELNLSKSSLVSQSGKAKKSYLLRNVGSYLNLLKKLSGEIRAQSEVYAQSNG